jgi:hypothetical protein
MINSIQWTRSQEKVNLLWLPSVPRASKGTKQLEVLSSNKPTLVEARPHQKQDKYGWTCQSKWYEAISRSWPKHVNTATLCLPRNLCSCKTPSEPSKWLHLLICISFATKRTMYSPKYLEHIDPRKHVKFWLFYHCCQGSLRKTVWNVAFIMEKQIGQHAQACLC